MDWILFGGLSLILAGLIIALSARMPADDGERFAYAFKGVVLAVVAVGGFIVGQWFTTVVFAGTRDTAFAALIDWTFTVPLLLMVLYALERGPRAAGTPPAAPGKIAYLFMLLPVGGAIIAPKHHKAVRYRLVDADKHTNKDLYC